MVLTRAVALIVLLVLISPLFFIGAEAVGYTEPLEIAAEKLGLKEESLWSGILPDYTFPGLPDVIGYVVAGLIGVAVLLLPAMVRGKLGASKGSG